MNNILQLKLIIGVTLLLLTCFIIAYIAFYFSNSWIVGVVVFPLSLLLMNFTYVRKKKGLILEMLEELLDQTRMLERSNIYDKDQKGNWVFGSFILRNKQQMVKVQYTELGIEVFFIALPKLGVRLLKWDEVSSVEIFEMDDICSSSYTAEIYIHNLNTYIHIPWEEKFKHVLQKNKNAPHLNWADVLT
jgi:hypothetical protein